MDINKRKRCYKQFCGVARALDVLGDRWTLLIVRDLLLGPWRYTDLLARLPGITTNLLAERLKEMETNGVVTKFLQASVGSPHVYELTPLGKQLEPVILSLATFGMHLMVVGPKTGDRVDIGRALLSLKLRGRGRGKGLVTLRLDSPTNPAVPTYYQVKYSMEYVDVHHGKPWQSEVEIALSIKNMTAILFGRGDAGAMERHGELMVSGHRKQWLVFLDYFGLKCST